MWENLNHFSLELSIILFAQTVVLQLKVVTSLIFFFTWVFIHVSNLLILIDSRLYKVRS